MKTKKYYTVGTFPKSNNKMVEIGKTDILDLTVHFTGLIQVLQLKVAGQISFHNPKPPLVAK